MLIISDNFIALDMLVDWCLKAPLIKKCTLYLEQTMKKSIASKHKIEVASAFKEIFNLDSVGNNKNDAFDNLGVFT